MFGNSHFFERVKHRARAWKFYGSTLSLSGGARALVHWFLLGALITFMLLSGIVAPLSEASHSYAALPYEPYPYATLPIESEFEKGKLEPFRLLAAFGAPGFGQVSFHNSCLKYESGSWSWLVTRTEGLQDTINARWIWEPVEGREFIIEAWNARPDQVGHTAMIIFRDGRVYQSRYPVEVPLMNFELHNVNWITVQMTIDYEVPEIRDLWINEFHFSHLRISDEPIGRLFELNGYWQMQIFLQGSSTLLVKEMQAWK
jgi:hypothetical protein